MPSETVQAVNNFETNSRRSHEVAETRTSRGRSAGYARGRPAGRYDGRRELTRLPANGLARPAKCANVKTATAAVPDPFGDGTERVLVTINRRVDILETERSHQRLTEAAYRTGRLLQAIFERAGGVGSSNWMGVSRQDPMIAQELRVLHSIMAAEEIEKLLRRIRARLGWIDARLLQRILGERWTFGQCADVVGRNGERGERYVAARFRDALEDLAEAWTAKGASVASFDDKYTAAAERADRPEGA